MRMDGGKVSRLHAERNQKSDMWNSGVGEAGKQGIFPSNYVRVTMAFVRPYSPLNYGDCDLRLKSCRSYGQAQAIVLRSTRSSQTRMIPCISSTSNSSAMFTPQRAPSLIIPGDSVLQMTDNMHTRGHPPLGVQKISRSGIPQQGLSTVHATVTTQCSDVLIRNVGPVMTTRRIVCCDPSMSRLHAPGDCSAICVSLTHHR